MAGFSEEFPLVLDGHEDFLTQMRGYQDMTRGAGLDTPPVQVAQRDFLEESSNGHVDLPRARRGGIGAAFASVWMRNEDAERDARATAAGEVDDLLRTVDRLQTMPNDRSPAS